MNNVLSYGYGISEVRCESTGGIGAKWATAHCNNYFFSSGNDGYSSLFGLTTGPLGDTSTRGISFKFSAKKKITMLYGRGVESDGCEV